MKQIEWSYRTKHCYEKLLKIKQVDAAITGLQAWDSSDLVFVSYFYNTYKPQTISF